jgi:hypothetical protein
MTQHSDKGFSHRLPLYQRVLGDVWNTLPAPIQAMHRPTGDRWAAEGMAIVVRGAGLLSRLAGALIGLPQAGQNVPVKVVFELNRSGERWRRTFAGRSFESFQWPGTGRKSKLLMERFGALTFGLELVFDGEKLHLIVRNWRLLGIPFPPALAPTGRTYEFVEHGRFCFHVEIIHPLTGLIVRYQGWLAVTDQASA